MEVRNVDFPQRILLDVPKGRCCNIDGQTFSTDNLPNRLQAEYEGVEKVRKLWSEIEIVKYCIEPIFSFKIQIKQDKNDVDFCDAESINKLCNLISQPYMEFVRSAVPTDEFVERDRNKIPYWLYTPDDKYHFSFAQNGIIWKAGIIGCESGYYYEYYQSESGRCFRKVGDREELFPKKMAVRPVVFFEAKAFTKINESSLEFV